MKENIQKIITIDPHLKNLFNQITLDEFIPTKLDIFTSLTRAIAHQMVHSNAAEACLLRLYELSGQNINIKNKKINAEKVAKLGVDQIKSCGFSLNKSLAIYDLALLETSQKFPSLKKMEKMNNDEIKKILLPLRGVGVWTIEMYLIFALGRSDIFPVDDFGVREGYRIWKGADRQLKPSDLKKETEKFSPYRTTLARALWKLADAHKKLKNK